MEPWKWQQLLWTVAFLGITYIPLQCVALWMCRGVVRVAAGLPLLVMIPMFFDVVQPLNYDTGSLFGMFFVCPYLPAMLYLIAVSLAGARIPRICPHCGRKRRIKSFQMTVASAKCAHCGKDMSDPAASESGAP